MSGLGLETLQDLKRSRTWAASVQVDAAVAQALEEGDAGGAGGLSCEAFAGLLLREEAQLDLYEDLRAAPRDASGAGKQGFGLGLDGRQESPVAGARSGCMGCCTS